MKNTLAKLAPTLIIFLTPLFFLPITLNFFQTNKLLLVIISTLLLLVSTAVRHLRWHQHQHLQSTLAWPLAIFWVVTILNLILTQEARFESLVGTGGLFLSLPLLTYFLTSLTANLDLEEKGDLVRWSLLGLIGSGTVLALLGIAQLTFVSDMTQLPLWLQSLAFTPAGSLMSLLIVLAVSTVTALVWALKEKQIVNKVLLLISAGIQLAAGVAYASLIIPGEKLVLRVLPIQAGWSIALDGLKAGRQLLIGAGLANFPVLYTNLKPSSLAQTDLWTTIFNRSSTELLHLLSTMGIVGLGAFVLVCLAVVGLVKKLAESDSPVDTALRSSLIALLISFVLFPASIVTYTLFFVLAGVAASRTAHLEQALTVSLPDYVSYTTATILIAVTLVSGVFTYRTYAAERAMYRAQQALAQNDANTVYDQQVKAINLAPRRTNYHISFAQINLQLASSLSQARAAAQDESGTGARELTEQERQQITTLIQRAIEQGQVSTQLRPSYYLTWQNLGTTYRNLINVVQGAEDFALQNVNQAVQLNPSDPNLRVEAGGLYYQLALLVRAQQQALQQQAQQQQAQVQIDPELANNLLDQAIQQFRTAVNLRPSYANAYYNLAKAYEAKENYRLAYQAMQSTLSNIEPDSADYQIAQEELLALEKLLPQTQETAAEPTQPVDETAPNNLQEPAPLPSPLPGGPIEIPEEEETGTNSPLQELNEPVASPEANPVEEIQVEETQTGEEND